MICISDAKEGKRKRRIRDRTIAYIAGIICPWINIPSMAQRRRFGDGLLFRQFAKSAYYFTPLPGTGYASLPPPLEGDDCVSRSCVRRCRSRELPVRAKAALNKLINFRARGQRGRGKRRENIKTSLELYALDIREEVTTPVELNSKSPCNVSETTENFCKFFSIASNRNRNENCFELFRCQTMFTRNIWLINFREVISRRRWIISHFPRKRLLNDCSSNDRNNPLITRYMRT